MRGKYNTNSQVKFKISMLKSRLMKVVHRLLTIIIIISFFKVDFYITFYNYKKPINVNLPIKLEKNSDTKRFANSLL